MSNNLKVLFKTLFNPEVKNLFALRQRLVYIFCAMIIFAAIIVNIARIIQKNYFLFVLNFVLILVMLMVVYIAKRGYVNLATLLMTLFLLTVAFTISTNDSARVYDMSYWFVLVPIGSLFLIRNKSLSLMIFFIATALLVYLFVKNEISVLSVTIVITINFLYLLFFSNHIDKLEQNLITENEQKQQLIDKLKLMNEEIEAKSQVLQNVNNQLKVSNIELERFAYIASHDLKEPIRSISSFSGLLERQLKKSEQDSHTLDYLKIIKNSSIQLHTLIEGVLEYSKINNDENKAQLKEINLTELVEQVKQMIQSIIHEQNVHIHIENNSPDFHTNRSQLFLVFKNLITNAIKYNKSTPKIIEVGYQDKMDFHQFYVKDNGIGIKPEYHDRIFEMFKRLHNRSEYQGTGLGLAICKKIIESMGGKIWCESSEKGSLFHFTILKKL